MKRTRTGIAIAWNSTQLKREGRKMKKYLMILFGLVILLSAKHINSAASESYVDTDAKSTFWVTKYHPLYKKEEISTMDGTQQGENVLLSPYSYVTIGDLQAEVKEEWQQDIKNSRNEIVHVAVHATVPQVNTFPVSTFEYICLDSTFTNDAAYINAGALAYSRAYKTQENLASDYYLSLSRASEILNYAAPLDSG
ncbi:MAG: hypothetical protein RSE23_10770 [Clostridia bacterium]